MRSLLVLPLVFVSGAVLSQAQAQNNQLPPGYRPAPAAISTSAQGSTYVPMDSWIYPALDRLRGLGYLDTAFVGLKPWTRLTIAHMLEESADRIDTDTNNDEARSIYLAVLQEVEPDIEGGSDLTHPHAELESVYTRFRGIGGSPLRDSYHLGQSIINDYGRPYAAGFNDYSGLSFRANAGRLSLYFRGEFEHAPGWTGYSPSLATYLSQTIDNIPVASNPSQATLPEGAMPSVTQGRVQEATISWHLLNHEISFGKSDHWMGPAAGGAMLWSNNAEDIYQFQIDRVEPLWIPGLSRLAGKFRYDFFVGTLKGHTDPNAPWVHVEKISFKPSVSMEIGFSRMVIWGGRGHEPITLHTFLKSFFSTSNVPESEKFSRYDPGARFTSADFSYRLPGLRHWMTIYTDSFIHDNVSPVVAPWSDGLRPGIYLAQFPGLPRLDLRVEAATTDPGQVGANRDHLGRWLYWETVHKQGTTNNGFLVGDWIGRQSKGGQAWLTWHLSPSEYIQLQYRNAKVSNAFIPGGTTQNVFGGEIRKRIGRNVEVLGSVQHEGWKAPIYKPGAQGDTTADVQITWFPHNHS